MPTDERKLVAERQEFGADRVNERGMVTIWKIRAANRALEDNIADDGKALFAIDEYDGARRVARAVQHIEGMAADSHGIALVQPTVWRDRARRQTVSLSLSLKGIEQRPVGLVRAFDGNTQPLF